MADNQDTTNEGERKERCGTCRFWEEIDENSGSCPAGECRRFPPVYCYFGGNRRENVTRYADDACLFPETITNQWCGEWKAKELPLVPGNSIMATIPNSTSLREKLGDALREVQYLKSLITIARKAEEHASKDAELKNKEIS